MDNEKLIAYFHRLATIEPPTQKGQTRRLFLHAEAELKPGEYGVTRKPYTLEHVILVARDAGFDAGKLVWTISGFAVVDTN